MSVLVKIVNYIWSNALKHRIFQGFLEDINSVYDDLLYHAEYMWLSRGKILMRFVSLKKEISNFIKSVPHIFPDLENESWKHDFAFFCDRIIDLNDLIIRLQEKYRVDLKWFNVSIWKCNYSVLTHYWRQLNKVKRDTLWLVWSIFLEISLLEYSNKCRTFRFRKSLFHCSFFWRFN